MVRPVSLSDPAFSSLRKEKREGESDSDVVLRLIHEARGQRKNPEIFLRWRPKRWLTPEEHLKLIEEFDALDQIGTG